MNRDFWYNNRSRQEDTDVLIGIVAQLVRAANLSVVNLNK